MDGRNGLRISLSILVGAFLWGGISGCGYLRRPETPLRAEWHTPYGSERARGLVVMMPGFGDDPEVFIEEGFVEAFTHPSLGYDVVLPDAHFGYYRRGMILSRLDQDVISSPRAAGYDDIWLLGVSMGGWGSLAYASENPERIRGLILLAPYMGPDDLIEEIEAAGGVASWEPGELAHIEDDRDRMMRQVWAFVKEATQRGAEGPDLYIGYGDDDRLKRPNGLVAARLPEDRVEVRHGGHGWTVWRPLMQALVPRAMAPAHPESPPSSQGGHTTEGIR